MLITAIKKGRKIGKLNETNYDRKRRIIRIKKHTMK
jgi:hypothetical protein